MAECCASRPTTAVILAAGLGSRLACLCDQPKPLAPLLGLSLIERAICTFALDLGIRRVIVVLGHGAEQLEARLRDVAARRGVSIECVRAANWQLGNGASALAVRDLVGEGPFFLAMADHLFDAEMGHLLAARPPRPGQILLAVDRDQQRVFDLEDVTRVRLADGRIAAIGKGLDRWDAADTGLFLCTDGLFEGLARAAAKGRHGLSDGVRELAAEGRALAIDASGHWWLDVDTPAAFREAERHLLAAEAGKAGDGPVARHLNRPISRWLTRKVLLRTNVTPNRVSLLSFALSCVGAVLLGSGGYAALAGGGLVAQIASIIDGCDGEIARFKRIGSAFGAWFDAVLDRYADAFLLFGLLWHAFWPSRDPLMLLVGFAAITGSFMSSYTADKYDGFMRQRGAGASYLRLGRDVRVFLIFLGALANLPYLTLWLIAVIMNAEVVRRIIILARAQQPPAEAAATRPQVPTGRASEPTRLPVQ